MEDNAFAIDTSPAPELARFEVPRYQVGRKSTELLQLEKESTPKFGRAHQSNPNHCWNCGKKNHSIRECNAEYNQITVEWNKAVLIMSKEYEAKKFQKRSGRYHETENFSEDHRFRKKPAVVSSQLRQILGLSDSELPPYVYRLRSHGYPRAWLKYATVKPSGINLYDAHGNEVADPNAEDGEILEEEDKMRYDLAKLIQFPGFNAPMPENSIDDFERMKSPPFNEEQSLKMMIKNLREKAVTEYRLKKNKFSSGVAISSSHEADDDMDVDCLPPSSEVENSFVAPLPNIVDRPPTPPPSDDTKSSLSQTDCESTSNELSQDSKTCGSSDVNKMFSPSSNQNGLGRILSSAEGTPLLKSKSGHTRLPPPENFSKDICDVINFENLPESTGKFEKMRGLLKKVKHILGIQRQNS